MLPIRLKLSALRDTSLTRLTLVIVGTLLLLLVIAINQHFATAVVMVAAFLGGSVVAVWGIANDHILLHGDEPPDDGPA